MGSSVSVFLSGIVHDGRQFPGEMGKDLQQRLPLLVKAISAHVSFQYIVLASFIIMNYDRHKPVVIDSLGSQHEMAVPMRYRSCVASADSYACQECVVLQLNNQFIRICPTEAGWT